MLASGAHRGRGFDEVDDFEFEIAEKKEELGGTGGGYALLRFSDESADQFCDGLFAEQHIIE